jgi:hypothetical protein
VAKATLFFDAHFPHYPLNSISFLACVFGKSDGSVRISISKKGSNLLPFLLIETVLFRKILKEVGNGFDPLVEVKQTIVFIGGMDCI